jgi:hypothetical protein
MDVDQHYTHVVLVKILKCTALRGEEKKKTNTSGDEQVQHNNIITHNKRGG